MKNITLVMSAMEHNKCERCAVGDLITELSVYSILTKISCSAVTNMTVCELCNYVALMAKVFTATFRFRTPKSCGYIVKKYLTVFLLCEKFSNYL
jgi:hypothetical protein